jgi:hypothetical protein
MAERTFEEIVNDAIEKVARMKISHEDKITLVVTLTILQTKYEEDCK